MTVISNYVPPVKNTAYTGSTTGTTKSTGGNALDGDDFMILLLAQLQHQNPLEPMDETTMMGQITQLNSLQELQKISAAIEASSKSSRLTEAAALIGKSVTYTTKDGKTESGVVTGASLVGNETMLYVGDKLVAQSSVTSVKEVPAETDSAAKKAAKMAEPIRLDQLNRLNPAAAGGKKPTPVGPAPADRPSFAQTLDQAQGVRLSNHAQQRLEKRQISLSEDNLARLSVAVDKASQRGGRELMVLMDDMAFIVNIKDRVIVTALDPASRREGVFTQIDFVVFADPANPNSSTSTTR